MRSKSSSPKKDDKVTAVSPTKKDPKAAPIIMTRQQSVVMNTRQLRNQDVSRKKISAITQLLLSPHKTKQTTFNKKKSPKDKKPKSKESPKKQQTVKVTQLVLEVKKDAKDAVRKRKIEREPQEVRPAKFRKETLSIQELIDICEEQSLDDEDFLEILTCESPVWWEQPDNQYYCEDAIACTPEQKKYFKQFFKSQRKTEETVTQNNIKVTETNINIPEVKKTDERFMKKRSKLENLLGNIKNKLTDTPKEDNKLKDNVVEKTLDIPEKMQAKETSNDTDIQKKVDENTTEDEIEIIKPRNVKTTSESTCSSDDMFFGFQNEDILKDLENMEIPIKEDELCKENSEYIDSSPEKCKEIENFNCQDNNKIEAIHSKEEVKTISANSTDLVIGDQNPIPNSSLDISKQVTDILKEDEKNKYVLEKDKSNIEAKKPATIILTDRPANTSVNAVIMGTQSILQDNLAKIAEKPQSLKSDKANTPETKVSVDSITNESNKGVNLGSHSVIKNTSSGNSETTEAHKPLDSVKIYYIDVSTSENDKASNKSDTKVTIKDVLTNAKSDKGTLCKESKNYERPSTGTIINKQKEESNNDSNNDVATAVKDNEALTSSTKMVEFTIVSKESKDNEIISIPTNITNQKNELDNNKQIIKDESKGNIVNVDNKSDKNDANKDDSNRTKIISSEESSKSEKDNKPVKAQQVNKDELMAVYRIITEKQYKQNYMNTVQGEVQKDPKIINSYLASADGLETFLNKCADSSKPHNPILKSLLAKEKDSSTDKVKSNVSDAEEKISNNEHTLNKDTIPESQSDNEITNEVDQYLNEEKANDKIVNSNLEESSTPINPIEIIKISENIKNEQTNIEKNKTDLQENEKLCGKCDDTSAETSFNITSKLKSAKYCLKCSSIFESETCSYCAKKRN